MSGWAGRYLLKSAAAAALGLTVTWTAAGCAKNRSAEVKRTIRIGVVVYDQYDTFISELMECFTAVINEKINESGRSIILEVMDAAGSQSTQNDEVKLLIEKGCDVICVNLVDRTEPTTITDLAEKNEVPIVFFNRELVEEDLERWDHLYYVGADAAESITETGSASMSFWKARPDIRMQSSEPNIRSML
ncbi:MAG: substrate-binding domain-containing protein [Lachnospiraceae bacterium]|nr:substrate-binding domain-containing protein [Lachnospiraceae bacterium]